MNKIYTIIIIFFLPLILNGTPQKPDKVLYKNKTYYLALHWSYSSPLEIYYYKKYSKSPFTMTSTANYRGFIATWIIKNNHLFLSKVKTRKYNVKLDYLFDKHQIKNNKVKANWFTGYISIQSNKIIKYHKSSYSTKFYTVEYAKHLILYIKKGIILKKYNMNNISESKKVKKLFNNYILNQKKLLIQKKKITPEQIKKYNSIKLKIDTIHKNHIKKLLQKEYVERRKDFKKSYKIYSKLKGFNNFIKYFKVDFQRTGMINSMPESMYFYIYSRKNNLINSITLWNPIHKDKLSSNWDEILNYYYEANNILSKHKWLLKWKNAGTNRSIDLYILGNSIGEEKFDYYNFILPPWRHAFLKEKPMYKIVLSGPKRWTADIYFNKIENKLLIPSINKKVYNIKHWIYKYKILYHPTNKIPEYIIVNPNGKHYLNKIKKRKEHK